MTYWKAIYYNIWVQIIFMSHISFQHKLFIVSIGKHFRFSLSLCMLLIEKGFLGMAVGFLVISYMQPPTGVVTFLCSSTTSLPEQHHWSSPSNNMIIWHPLMHDGEWGARPWNWCLRRCLKRKTFKMDERKIDFTLISLHGWCLENKPVLCPLCVAALSLTRKRGDPFLSLLLILSNTHMVTHTKQRQKQPCMRRRKLLRCWSTDRENKDGRSFSTLPCLTWATDVNDIVNMMWL